jgi:RHS repeat-associated protein
MDYQYDAAGRVVSYTSPLNAAFRTTYGYRPADGAVDSLTTTAASASPIASAMKYRAFGGLAGYTTASIQVVTGGSRTLQLEHGYRENDSLAGITASFVGTGSVSSLDLVNTVLSYNQAGMLVRRDDAADATASRYYEYDALQRLTCESRGGTSADCTVSSSKLAGLFGYVDGQSGAPVDARTSAYIKSADASYISPSSETYAYGSGVAQVQSVTRSDGNLVLGYDAVGRRVYDYQGAGGAAGPGRRDYTYLPNGQLGTISGQRTSGEPYVVSLRYDETGHPITISNTSGDNYELFWDDANRLVAASITGAHQVRWHYHYLGVTLIAATREVVGTPTEVKRFWAITDDRELITRLVDEVGATYWQASWDATAWRTLQGVPQPDMWVPFGLAGQLILDGTEARDPGASAALRPALVINQFRVYDPLFGAFLQPDPADATARLSPEGYLYGRGNYVANVDPSGAQSRQRPSAPLDMIPGGWDNYIDPSCSDNLVEGQIQADLLNSVVAGILSDIEKCKSDECGKIMNENIRRQWRFALLTGTYYCATKKGTPVTQHGQKYLYQLDTSGKIKLSLGDSDFARTGILQDGETLSDRVTVFGTALEKGGCWKRLVAHEALHGVLETLPVDFVNRKLKQPHGTLLTGGAGSGTWAHKVGQEHDVIMNPRGSAAGARIGLEMCVNCE